MLPLPKSALGIAAGVSGLIFVGYCLYFDRKRHADPEFKKKLRDKRRQARQARLTGARIPDLRDQAAVQQFFLSEIQLGEELLSQGDVEGAVEHLGSAISVCGHPQQLLQILQSTLPPQVFHILIQRLPMIGQSVKARHLAQFGAPINSPGGQGAGFPGMMGPPPLSMMGNPQILAMDEELE